MNSVKPLRWLLVADRYWPAIDGPGLELEAAAAALAERGAHVRVLARRGRREWPECMRMGDVSIERLGPAPDGRFGFQRLYRAAQRWLEQRLDQIDHLLVRSRSGLGQAALQFALRWRIPAIIWPTGDETAEELAEFAHRAPAVWREPRSHWSVDPATAIVARDGAHAEALAAAGFHPQRVELIGRAPPQRDRWTTSPRLARRVLSAIHPELRIDDAAPLALCPVMPVETERYRALLANWRRAAATAPRARLWLLGEDGDQAAHDAVRSAAAPGEVVWAGSFDSLDELIAAADVLIDLAGDRRPSYGIRRGLAAGRPAVQWHPPAALPPPAAEPGSANGSHAAWIAALARGANFRLIAYDPQRDGDAEAEIYGLAQRLAALRGRPAHDVEAIES